MRTRMFLLISGFLLIAGCVGLLHHRSSFFGYPVEGERLVNLMKDRMVIDRYEGEYAVVLWGPGEKQIDLPRDLLPEGAREGDWLRMSLEIDRHLTEMRREEIAEKLKKLMDR